MEIQKEHFVDRSKQALAKRVKVQGGQVYIGKDLNQVLIHAEDEAKQMGDEYVSVEHLFLSMLQYPNKRDEADLFRVRHHAGAFLQALSTVRGNQRVPADNPEATYDTLEKYGQDLVERRETRSWIRSSEGIMKSVTVRILSRKRRTTRF